MAQPTVSIVIPAYNREGQIERAIQSVLDQDIDNIEILVIDDCSKDNTVAVVESITDNRVTLIKHAKNKGEAGARNTGVKAAKGTYVAYLDSDDYWLPDKLKAQLDVMGSAPDDVGGVYTLHQRLYQNGKISVAGATSDEVTFTSMLTKGTSISAGNTLLFKRDLFEKVGDYDEKAPLYVDWDWLLRFLKIARLVRIDEPYAVYEKNPYYRPGTLLETARDIFIEKFKQDIDALTPQKRRECLSRINLDIARGYAENESKRKALSYYWKAITLKPSMSAGSYLNMIDGLTGLNFLPYIDSWYRSARR
jgi:glycosyltransferase involved in cell wall biosynthesis